MSERPSSSKLDNLGSYLLVSLFFVVFAMLEFALVLLIKRNQAVKVQNMNHDSRKTSAYKSRSKISDVSMVKVIVGCQDNGSLPFLDNTKDPSHPKQEARRRMWKCLVLNDVRMSTDNIDMIAFVLFIACYSLYNLFYWM